MKTILIPTDFSENSWNALVYALKFFRDYECIVYILHVGSIAQSSTLGNSFAFPNEPISPDLRKKLNTLFQRIRKLPKNKNHRFIALQEYGNFVNALRKVVSDKKIDLIVMGTKGASGIKKTVVGSNTGDVITKIQCNVLVIPEKAEFNLIQEVTFATDYNLFYTNAILECLTDILNTTNAQLQVLQILKSGQTILKNQKENKDFLFNFLNETVPKITSHEITNENTIKGIQEFMAEHNIGLLIMAAKNLNFLQQLFFDSTIEKLSFQIKIPLWVLHE